MGSRSARRILARLLAPSNFHSSSVLLLIALQSCGAETGGGGPSSGGTDASNDAALDATVPDAIDDGLVAVDGKQDITADGEVGAMFTTILDHFDRPDGDLDSAGVAAWIDDGKQGLSQYRVAGGELVATDTASAPVWWSAYHGGSSTVAEAFITVRQLAGDTQDFSLLLVSQTLSPCDFIQVRYDAVMKTLGVSSCQLGTSTSCGPAVDVDTVQNRRIGVRLETPSGKLSVYVDAMLVGSCVVDQWRYLGRPGRIGLWLRRAGASSGVDRFDDFGGG